MTINLRIAVVCLAAIWMAATLRADIIVDPATVVGKVKIMNAVNNGPVRSRSDQVRDNFDSYRKARIPYARTHDAGFQDNYGGQHTVDISAIFPDFNAKVSDPASYDFVLTDMYLKNIQDAGTKVFFRLGQKIEHNPKKYYVYPPKDSKKWAQVCEHIIRHYTEGWADGHKWNIEYWEIWNEPDLDARTWAGTPEQFFELYKTTALHLKKCFPNLKIGGPALCGNEEWADRFLKYMSENSVPIDFFSWHIYATHPEDMASKADRIHALLQKHGYKDTESILDEWNYVKGWTADYPYSVKVMNSMKGAAFTAATMNACQEKPVDMLMYYDARYGTVFNGLFDFYDFSPTPTYYVLYGWAKLLDYETEVKATGDNKDIYVTAAHKNGKTRVMLARYTDDDNQVAAEVVNVGIAGGRIAEAMSYVTDERHLYTEVPVDIVDGKAVLRMEPHSVVMLEF